MAEIEVIKRSSPGNEPQPETIDMAVGVLLGILGKQEIERIASMTPDELDKLHASCGSWIRNSFGLWQHDSALLLACGVSHPDDASMVILQSLWRHLQGSSPVVH